VSQNNHSDLILVNREDAGKGIEAANRYFTDKIKDIFASIQ
jgi:membrane-bound lytic murein transglycosylase MltF